MYKVPSDPSLPLRGCVIAILLLLFLVCYGLSSVELIRYELGEGVAMAVTVVVVVLAAAVLLWLARQLERDQ